MNEQIRRAEQRVPHVGHDDGVVVQKRVQPLEERLDGHAAGASPGPKRGRRWRGRGSLPQRSPAQSRPQQAAHEILEAHIFVVMVTDGKFLARRVNRPRRIEPRREHAHVDVASKMRRA